MSAEFVEVYDDLDRLALGMPYSSLSSSPTKPSTGGRNGTNAAAAVVPGSPSLTVETDVSADYSQEYFSNNGSMEMAPSNVGGSSGKKSTRKGLSGLRDSLALARSKATTSSKTSSKNGSDQVEEASLDPSSSAAADTSLSKRKNKSGVANPFRRRYDKLTPNDDEGGYEPPPSFDTTATGSMNRGSPSSSARNNPRPGSPSGKEEGMQFEAAAVEAVKRGKDEKAAAAGSDAAAFAMAVSESNASTARKNRSKLKKSKSKKEKKEEDGKEKSGSRKGFRERSVSRGRALSRPRTRKADDYVPNAGGGISAEQGAGGAGGRPSSGRGRSRSLLRGVRGLSNRGRNSGAFNNERSRGGGGGGGGSSRRQILSLADRDDDDDDSTASCESLEHPPRRPSYGPGGTGGDLASPLSPDEDPLIDLFETHNTRRVVFDPTFAPPPTSEDVGRGGGGGGAGGLNGSGTGGSFNIKGFMNRIILKGGKEKEAEITEIPSAIIEPEAPEVVPAAAISAGGGGVKFATDANEEAGFAAPSSSSSPRPMTRAGSALRSGRLSGNGGSNGTATGQQAQHSSLSSSPSNKAAKFDPFVIDKAKSRSTTTAAVARAAITRSFRNESGIMASSNRDLSSSSHFVEDPETTKSIEQLLSRANRAHARTYRYEHAIGYYLAALELLTKEGYPEEHELMVKSVRKLNDCHHAQSSLKNSANIVKMGIKHENRGEFVRALKMYTIAYRIRRDALSKFHPSLPVLLNMLGSVQVKRGELKEAMQIFELALNGRPDDMTTISERRKSEMIHPMTKSVTLRDMGMIYERWGDDEKALKLYEDSLAYVMKNRQDVANQQDQEGVGNDDVSSSRRGPNFLSKSLGRSSTSSDPKYVSYGDEGEMEVYLETGNDSLQTGTVPGAGRSYKYDAFFPPTDDEKSSKRRKSRKEKNKNKSGKGAWAGREGSDVNVAITLHQIAQINRRRGQHAVALSAYQVALRGMKQALGAQHPNVAAILGNLGNLHKEMGNFDEAYSIYQEVLSIETHHLGLCHPEVSVTLHNIATIESSRGRYSDAISLYTQVIKMQKSLFGPNHISVAVTSSCMGDVYERMCDTKNAMNMYEETLRIKTEILGRKHVDVGRLMHKIGCLALQRGDFKRAEVYITKAAAIYIENNLEEKHPWVRDLRRNEADIKGLLATGLGEDMGEL